MTNDKVGESKQHCFDENKTDSINNTCPICFDDLITPNDIDTKSKSSKSSKSKQANNLDINKIIKLDCGHQFHYECITEWFKQKKIKNPYSSSGKNIRVCPYCREKSGYIELPENTFPIKHIHYEYKYIQDVINTDDHNKIIEICKPYFNPKYCFCILKTGPSKGQQCRKYKSKGSDVCFIHKKKLDSIKG
jgi:hypothetical protein